MLAASEYLNYDGIVNNTARIVFTACKEMALKTVKIYKELIVTCKIGLIEVKLSYMTP